MGALHPVEQLLILLLAFGPFLVLGVVVYVVRRRDIEEEDRAGSIPVDAQQDQQQDR